MRAISSFSPLSSVTSVQTSEDQKVSVNKKRSGKMQKILRATLPLLSLGQPLRTPMNVTASSLRAILHGTKLFHDMKEGAWKEATFSFLHAALAVCMITLFFFKPIVCIFLSFASDLIINMRSLIESIRSKNILEAIEDLVSISLNILFIIAFIPHHLQLLAICAIIQLAVNIYFALREFSKGNYIEGASISTSILL